MVEAQAHPFAQILQSQQVGDKSFKFFNMAALDDPRYAKLPYSIRVLLESAIRNCDNFNVKSKSMFY
jgi:aconitate hydratase